MKSWLSGFLFAALPFAPNEMGGSRQIIFVKSKGISAEATLYQKDENLWRKAAGPWPAVVGRKGVVIAEEKREGDGRTPLGLYPLGFSFGHAPKSPATWPYKQMTVEDKWIDDPSSSDYNKLIRGPTNAKSFEKMRTPDLQYEWGLVVEYNMHPIVPGKGSAIFLHVWKNEKTGTAGCVALEKENVLNILSWLDSTREPRILIE